MAKLNSYPSKWRSFWFWTSLLAVFLSLVALIGLVWAGSVKEWFAERFSGVYTPVGAVLVASFASLGAALNYYHQAKDKHDREIEESNYKREGALWDRSHRAAEAFGIKDSDLVGIRQSGVYALCGVGDDWIRHRRPLGDTDRALRNEV
ncbi:hypothetical protein [Rhodococcoides fascians]|uniref:hypothetical protein n=1 Tax=Rhodococcoides fascians TaxID=1828 RepID=UPI0018AF9840|nr:hypothetical protein [Rhodococcus fascians]